MRQLVLVAVVAGIDKPPDVLVKQGPPQSLMEALVELAGVSPPEDAGPQGRRNKQAIRGTCAGTRLTLSQISQVMGMTRQEAGRMCADPRVISSW